LKAFKQQLAVADDSTSVPCIAKDGEPVLSRAETETLGQLGNCVVAPEEIDGNSEVLLDTPEKMLVADMTTMSERYILD
jgi:hypothetical protein